MILRLSLGSTVAGLKAIQGLDLFRSDGSSSSRTRRRSQVVRTRPDDTRRRLRMCSNRRVSMGNSVRRTRAVVRRRAATVAPGLSSAVVQVSQTLQMVMMVVPWMRMPVQPRRVGFYRGTSGQRTVRAFRVGTRGPGDSSQSRRRGAFDNFHRASISLNFHSFMQSVFPTSASSHYRVDAEPDFRLRGYRDYWRRCERHHRTLNVSFT